ncbi:MAG TPA: histidinol-phosphatase [Actinomycetota bacterium]|jgi:histidinol-phosphatase|nr:histidinol-phosphatase [Actinomycetota bacterium]
MDTNPNLVDLRLALDLADLADAVTMERFRASDLVVETKPDLTPVSEADRAVEQLLRKRIVEERPDHAVLGEEFGGDGAGATARWIIDPIDGTKNYVRGIPVYATLIALERHGFLSVGVASAPALGRRWWAARDHGAFADGVPMRASKVARLEDAQLGHSSVSSWRQHGLMEPFLELERRCWRGRGFGDFWTHMMVAEGAVDVAAEPEVSLWDVAAVQVIVEEAGGRFTNLAGVPRPDGGSAVSTNGLLHDEVLGILTGGGQGGGRPR